MSQEGSPFSCRLLGSVVPAVAKNPKSVDVYGAGLGDMSI